MTITMPAHRALTSKLAGRSFNVVTRMGYNPWIARVNTSPGDKSTSYQTSESSPPRVYAIATRTYATAATKKAPTKRAAATKTTKSKKTSKKPAAKTKTVKPAAKKKAAKKVPTKAPRKFKVTKSSIATKARNELNDLKQTALYGQDPHGLPETAWTILLIESQTKGRTFPESQQTVREAGQRYRSLASEEREQYNHRAVTNKQQNKVDYQKWVTSFTPKQIHDANNARKQLNRRREEAVKERGLKTRTWSKQHQIQDDRQPKRPAPAYARFNADRQHSGDFTGMTIPERAKLIGREWKALSAAERKPFDDAYNADLTRYAEEVRTVLGKEPDSKNTRS